MNAIGSYQPHTREIDTATVTGGRFVVDDVEAVLAEAGDVQIPIAEGAFSADSIVGRPAVGPAGRTARRRLPPTSPCSNRWESPGKT